MAFNTINKLVQQILPDEIAKVGAGDSNGGQPLLTLVGRSDAQITLSYRDWLAHNRDADIKRVHRQQHVYIKFVHVYVWCDGRVVDCPSCSLTSTPPRPCSAVQRDCGTREESPCASGA